MPYIFLAEDDPFLTNIYTKKLQEAGFEVEVVGNGSKVLNQIFQRKPDILLLDIVLPDIPGWEILKRIKEDPILADLKVVILSSLGQQEEVEKGLALGAEGYLIKTQFKPSEIVEKVKEFLKIPSD